MKRPPERLDIALVTEPGDIAAVADLARAIWPAHYVPIIGKEQVDYMLERFQSPRAIEAQIREGYEYYLLRADGEQAGYCALVIEREARRMMLSKIYVRADRRGLGLGKAIVHFAESRARETGCRELWLTVNRNNTDSIAFYEHMGFRKDGALKTDIGNGFVMDDFRMVKP